MTESATAALEYAAKGWPVFPVNGKVPLTPNGFKDATTERSKLVEFWETSPIGGVAIATGNGIGVLDIDPRSGGEEGFVALLAGRALPNTPMCLTGGGGRHYYFRLPPSISVGSRSGIRPGVDWKSSGGYVVAPPSLHASGKKYEWEASSHPDDIPLAEIPAWLLAEIQGPKPGASKVAGPMPEKIPEGQRHDWLLTMAGTMRRKAATKDEMLAFFVAANKSGRFDPPLEMDEMERVASDYALKDVGPEILQAKEPKTLTAYAPKRLCDLLPTAWEQLRDPEKRPKGFKTGLVDLDDMTHGLHRGEVTILGARTSVGKSSLALRIAEGAARENDVLIFSIEMSELRVATNILMSMGRVDSHRARSDSPLLVDEGARVLSILPDAQSLFLWVDNSHGLDAETFAARTRAFVKDHPNTLVILDYLQIVRSEDERSRQEEVAAISRTTQALALELNIPILAMAQLNRDVEKRPDHWPNISDLRESGSIESDARCVMLLHRPGMHDEKIPKSQAILQIVKNSNGPTGHIELMFIESSMRFENAAKYPKQEYGE